MPRSDITLFGLKLSGHLHRIVLLLELLQLPYRYVETRASDRADPAFIALSPLGQVPVLRDGETVMVDSNAILIYLAGRYAPNSAWMPRDPVDAARVQRWLSIAAGELRYGPALARAIALWRRPQDPVPARTLAAKLFAVMDAHLATSPFLAAKHPTIADLACWTYTAHAPEGGVALDGFPHVRDWLTRVAALPGFVPLTEVTS